MDHGYSGGQPGVSFVGDDGNDAYQQEAYYDEGFPEAKPATKKGKKNDKSDKNDKNDKSTKEKKPIVPSYEGYLFTVLDAIRPGETVSWIRTRRSMMPLTSQELHDKAIAYKKESGLGASGQFQALGPNQREIVNRLVAEKNAAEKEANAAWTLFGVRRMYKEQKSLLKTWRINDAIRVTLRRGDKTKDVASDLPRSQVPFEDKANIVDLSQPAVKKEKEKEKEKDPVPKKKKKQQAANAVPDYYNDQQYGEPYQQDYAQNVDPYPAYENTQPQHQAQWPQQHQQPHHDPFQQPQHDPFQQPQHDPFQQPQHDPFATHDMHGALPGGAIPVPPQQHHQQQHDYRPEAPMPPQQHQYQHENPFQSDPRVFPQAQPTIDPFQVDERQPRNPVAHGQQPFSARRPSHSRHRSLSRPRSHSRRRDSVDSERRRAEDERKMAAVVRNEVRGVMREVAAEDKILNRWHTRSGSGSAGSSSRSTAPEDFWSQAGSSGDRRFSYNTSTPDTSPDRGERYYADRPTSHFRRRDSSGARPYVDDRKRYYMERDRNYVVKPHDTYREHGRDREPRYLRDRRQSYDDYPLAHQRRSSRERHYERERPRIQRRVTDHPEAFHDADFGRPSRGGVDYERTRMYDRDDRRHYAHGERRDRRGDRQPAGYHG
jgi:hypothetical protein